VNIDSWMYFPCCPKSEYNKVAATTNNTPTDNTRHVKLALNKRSRTTALESYKYTETLHVTIGIDAFM